jgi:multicomponent Na+:H+ antiporter subunit E
MSTASDLDAGGLLPAAIARGAGFLAFWVILIGFGPVDLLVGLITAAAAAWTSLRLLPPQPGRVRLTAVVSLIPHFLWKSVVASVDVARRALDPRLPLRPGFIAYRVGFAPGPACNVFAAITSLMPGTVPCADEDGALIYHCLDIGQPVVEELAEEERRLAQAREAPRDG